VSFIKRAQEATKHVAEQAKVMAGDAAEQARLRAGDAAEQGKHVADQARAKAGDAADQARAKAGDPATTERLGKQARDAVGMAKRGFSTVVERIDPGTLADLIIKATALQEMTNAALRKKGSPYRISEIAIEASIPPGVAFSIGRIDDPEELLPATTISSEELVEALPAAGESVISLDGTTIDDAAIADAQAALAEDDAMEMSGREVSDR
jgi:hypothetical protein